MKLIYFKFTKNFGAIVEWFYSFQYGTIAYFLVDEVGSDIDFFIKWFIGDESQIDGNLIELKKVSEGILFSVLYSSTKKTNIILSKNDFLEVLKEWKEIYKQQPQEVFLEKKDGKYTFTILKS